MPEAVVAAAAPPALKAAVVDPMENPLAEAVAGGEAEGAGGAVVAELPGGELGGELGAGVDGELGAGELGGLLPGGVVGVPGVCCGAMGSGSGAGGAGIVGISGP